MRLVLVLTAILGFLGLSLFRCTKRSIAAPELHKKYSIICDVGSTGTALYELSLLRAQRWPDHPDNSAPLRPPQVCVSAAFAPRLGRNSAREALDPGLGVPRDAGEPGMVAARAPLS
jgi:hypothetical protein